MSFQGDLVLGVCQSDNVSDDCKYFIDWQNQMKSMDFNESNSVKTSLLKYIRYVGVYVCECICVCVLIWVRMCVYVYAFLSICMCL